MTDISHILTEVLELVCVSVHLLATAPIHVITLFLNERNKLVRIKVPLILSPGGCLEEV